MTDIIAKHKSRIGVGLVIAGVLLNPWLIGYLATDDGSLDRQRLFAAILFVSGACVLGGLQLLFRWVDRLWSAGPVGFRKGAAVVGLVALVNAGTHWRIVSYQSAHNHTMLVTSAHEHATADQQKWSEDFYQRSLAAAQKNGWFDINNALAQGFQPDRVNGSHYPNLAYMFDDVILDPERPEWLVYDDSPQGKVLMALMFFTRTLEEVGPTPGGPIAQWHYHPYETPRCAIKGLWTVGRPDDEGHCAEGIPVTRTPEMLHVWFMDHPLGRWTEMKIVPDYRADKDFPLLRLHPIAVHFAIALFVVGVLLDVVAIVASKPQYHWPAWINLTLGVLAATAAITAGMTAEASVRVSHEVHQTLDTHKLLGFSGFGIILLLCAWRFALRGGFPQRAAVLYCVLSVAGLAAIGGAGYYGGELVYDHGVGVRAIDTFTRDTYWKKVQAVYRQAPAEVFEHAGHQNAQPKSQ